MGKNKEVKKYIDISGFYINHANRGNAALAYGALGFLVEKGLVNEDDELIYFQIYNNFLKWKNIWVRHETYNINGRVWKRTVVPVHKIEKLLIAKFGIILPFTYFGRYINKVRFEAADYGGDGFSDIYGDKSFMGRMCQTWMLRRANVPLIMLPQTIGPFAKKSNYDVAVKIMRYAKDIYVRDGKFITELEKLKLEYTQTKDISSFMQPEPWDIEIKPNALGLNVSGLAYCNAYHGLEGQFDVYPELIDRLINHYKGKGFTIYLVPHSYTYNKPDNNDDMVACRQTYARLTDKSNVVLIDKDMTAPQVKYVISKMKYFIGARMHANFAAIYTGVPVFGTAYSYKFQGAFDANGLDGEKQTAMLNNLKESEIDGYIEKIDKAFRL